MRVSAKGIRENKNIFVVIFIMSFFLSVSEVNLYPYNP